MGEEEGSFSPKHSSFPSPSKTNKQKIFLKTTLKMSKYSSRHDSTTQIASEIILEDLKSQFFSQRFPQPHLGNALYSLPPPPELKILNIVTHNNSYLTQNTCKSDLNRLFLLEPLPRSNNTTSLIL